MPQESAAALARKKEQQDAIVARAEAAEAAATEARHAARTRPFTSPPRGRCFLSHALTPSLSPQAREEVEAAKIEHARLEGVLAAKQAGLHVT